MDVTFSPDGSMVVGAMEKNTSLILWDVTTGDKRTTFDLEGGPRATAFSPDGKMLAVSIESYNGPAKQYGEKVQLLDLTNTIPRSAIQGQSSFLNAVIYSRDGSTLACAGDEIKLWDPSTGNHIRTIPTIGRCNSLDYSSDGRWLAAGNFGGAVGLWDSATGDKLREWQFGGRDDWMDVTFDPTGRYLAAAKGNGTIYILQLVPLAVTTSGAPPFGPTPPPAVAPFDAKQARAHQEAWAKHLGKDVETTNSIGMKMILIPPGEFLMGSSDAQIDAVLKLFPSEDSNDVIKDRIRGTERPQHRVVLTKPFLLSATEVTIGQFKTFVNDTGYETDSEKMPDAKKAYTYAKPGEIVLDNYPASHLSWKDADAYCQWLSKQEKATYRLPTEAEWEYASRAGTNALFSFGDDVTLLKQYAWTLQSKSTKLHPVGSKPANAFGLFDTEGNLQEWCKDYYAWDWYEVSPTNDPAGPPTGNGRVLRGASYGSSDYICHVAYRQSYSLSAVVGSAGFRVVRELGAVATPIDAPKAASNRHFVFRQGSMIVTPIDRFASSTLEAWIRPRLAPPIGEKDPNNNARFVFGSDLPGGGGWCAGMYYRQNEVQPLGLVAMDSTHTRIFSPNPIPLDRWMHFAVVFAGQRTSIFLDGKLSLNGAAKPVLAGEPFVIGHVGVKNSADMHFYGEMRDVRISKGERYGKDFTPPVVLVTDTDTLALYSADALQDQRVIDKSGHGNDGVARNLSLQSD